MKRIYLSGPMTGRPDNNFESFATAAKLIRAKGFEVVNPAELLIGEFATWRDFMRADIKALCDCDTLAYLPGWETSDGAHLEIHLAHRLGLKIVAAVELTGIER